MRRFVGFKSSWEDAMSNPPNEWPTEYYVGPAEHIHAFGVLSTAFNSFEDRLFPLYEHHFRVLSVPYELSEFTFLNLIDHQRLNAINKTFALLEKDSKVVAVIDNLIEYFKWCSDVRDKLAHAEAYPMAFFGKQTNHWHLTKRMSRRDPRQGYIQLSLSSLREMADKVAYGPKHCSRLQIYLRVRDFPRSELPPAYLEYADEPLPEILPIPDSLKLSPRPDSDS
jgi:hypothetical protein